MNPGVSDASTGVLPQRSHQLRSADDCRGRSPSHGTTSTSGMTGAGLKKCKPITRSGRLARRRRSTRPRATRCSSRAPRPSATTSSRRRNSDCFASRSSTIASITSPQSPITPTRSSPSGSHWNVDARHQMRRPRRESVDPSRPPAPSTSRCCARARSAAPRSRRRARRDGPPPPRPARFRSPSRRRRRRRSTVSRVERHQRPVNTGLRFSRNAFTPSA